MRNKKMNWIAVSFGTCMGAGVLFLPNQVGLSGIWSFIFALPIVFVLSYFGQRFIADVVSSYPDHEGKRINYSDIIEECFGKIGGKLLVLLFFLIMFGIAVAYITGFKNDLYAFFTLYFPNLIFDKESAIYLFWVILFFAILLFFKNRILMVVMRIKTLFIMLFLSLFSVALIPYWHVETLGHFPTGIELLRGVLMVIPILITGTSFFGNVSEMAVDFKYDPRYQEECSSLSRSIIFKAEVLIFLFITFFVFSSTLALTHGEFINAAKNSQTALSVLQIPGLEIFARWMGLVILPASFLGVYIAINETVKKMIFPNYVKSIIGNSEKVNRFEQAVGLGVMGLLFLVLFLRINVLGLIGLFIAPIMCILVFVVPVVIIIRMKKLQIKMTPIHLLIAVVGVLLTLSYLIGDKL